MAPDERSLVEASQALTEQLGPAAAAALMECIPPFGWHEIATKADVAALGARIDRVELRMDRLEAGMDRLEARMDRLEARIGGLESMFHAEIGRLIRWTVGSIFAGIAAVSGAAGAIAAVLG